MGGGGRNSVKKKDVFAPKIDLINKFKKCEFYLQENKILKSK